MVTQFYADIARLPQISDQEMGTSMQQLSIQQNDEFDTIAALKELYIYVTTYKEQVSATFLLRSLTDFNRNAYGMFLIENSYQEISTSTRSPVSDHDFAK